MAQTFSPLLDRNKVVGHRVDISVSNTNSGVFTGVANPYKPVNPWNLVSYMFLLHARKGLTPTRSKSSYLREAKRLIDCVGTEKAESLVLESARCCNKPWGFVFIEKLRGQSENKSKFFGRRFGNVQDQKF